MIREIDIWRVAVLMVNRYAEEAKANSDRRAAELCPKGESRRSCAEACDRWRSCWSGYLASGHRAYRHDGTTALIMVRSLAANYPTTISRPEEIRVFRLTRKIIFFLIARTGFDHMDLVML